MMSDLKAIGIFVQIALSHVIYCHSKMHKHHINLFSVEIKNRDFYQPIMSSDLIKEFIRKGFEDISHIVMAQDIEIDVNPQ